tara:strand:+ start:323 stop:862 length:540 start_codon:yes stop_codon:yes gene_type:complete
VYLIFNSVIIDEIQLMKSQNGNKILLNAYLIFLTNIFFIFIFINITEIIIAKKIVEIIIVIWLFDTFSYLGGKIIGGKKLMPFISSGKTQSGLFTGITFTLIISFTYLVINDEFSMIYIIVISLIILFAFLGDLLASIIKRLSSIKDSGSILPGHGGLLDRLDSFIGVFFFIGIFKLFS